MSLKQTLVSRDDSQQPEINEKTIAAAVTGEESPDTLVRKKRAIPKKRWVWLQ